VGTARVIIHATSSETELLGGLGESQTKLIEMTERSAATRSAASMTHATARGAVVDKLVEYLAHKSIYEKKGATDIPDFTERVAPEIALEL